MQIASWLQSQPLSAFSSLNLVVSHKAEWNKVFWRSCELQLRLTEVSKLSSKVYLKQKVPENWVQTNYHYGYILENNLVISKLNFWPTDVLCFCARLPRLESEAAHVLGNRRATSHMTVQTTDPPPEAVTFCKSTSMFSRSGAEMSLLLSSTCPIYSSNSMKPDSLPLTPAMLYTMWLNQEWLNQACPRLHCCPGINARGGKAEGKTPLQNGERGALREVWLKEILLPLTVTLLATSSSGTSLLPAPPPPAYLALALCRRLHPLVQLTEFAGDGGKESFLLN